MKAGGKRSAGFTIVETLIVLAVSSALVTVAILYIGGKQNKTQFMVAINNQKQFIEQTINETANGYYPNNVPFTCTGNASGNTTTGVPATIVAGGGNGQGTSSGCIFIGKAMIFGAVDSGTVVVYPIMGNQKITNAGATQDVQSFNQAYPIALGGGVNPANTSGAATPNLAVASKLENGLTFLKASWTYYDIVNKTYTTINSSGSPKPEAAFAIAYNLANYSVTNGNLGTSNQSLDLFGFRSDEGWPQAASVVAGANQLNNETTVVNSPPPGLYSRSTSNYLAKVDLCFQSGGTNQSGKVTVTGLGQLAVNLQIYNDTTCT